MTGDTLYVSVPADVKWSSASYDGNVTIELDRNYPSGTWETVATNVPNTGTTNVTITGTASTTARFRIFEAANPVRGDTMRGAFNLQRSTTLTTDPLLVEETVDHGDSISGSLLITNSGSTDARVTLTSTTGLDNYTALHSTDPNGPEYAWIDASTGTAGPTGDDASSQLTLPFPVTYYGQTYTRIYMATNGWLSFLDPGSSASNYYAANGSMPNRSSNMFLAVIWDDLYIQSGVSSCRMLSDTANHRVVFSWIQAERYDDRTCRINAQAIFYQDGRIVYQYGTMTGTVNSATVGMQKGNGTKYIEVYNTVEMPQNHAVGFDYHAIWGVPQELTFNIPAGGNHTLNYQLTARSFDLDTTLIGSWVLSGNVVPVTIPVTLHVGANGAHDAPVPTAFSVGEAYPNPFNPTTSIDFTLDRTCQVKMTVYDVLGRKVATVLDARMDAGSHRQLINAGRWATGVYFVRVNAGEHQLVRKLLLLK